MSYDTANGQDLCSLAGVLYAYLYSLPAAGYTQPAKLVSVYNMLLNCGDHMNTYNRTISREMFRQLRRMINRLRHGHGTRSAEVATIVADAENIYWCGTGSTCYAELVSDRTLRRYKVDSDAFHRQWAASA